MATFEVFLKLKTATLFNIAYCISSFIVFDCFKHSWSQKLSKIEHKLQEKRQTWKISDVKHCKFLIRKETTYLILSPRNVLNHLFYQDFQKWYSNNMKNLHKLEFLELFENFCVKLQSFDPWKGWSFYKSCVGKYKNVKNKICWLFRGPSCNFFFQNCIYFRKQLYWTTKSFAVDRIQRFD